MKAVLKVGVERIAIDRWDPGRIISNHLGPIMRRQDLQKRQHCRETRRQQKMRRANRRWIDSIKEARGVHLLERSRAVEDRTLDITHSPGC